MKPDLAAPDLATPDAGDDLLHDPTRTGNSKLNVVPFGATPFKELLAIGQINGKIYAFDMIHFGTPSGATPAQARLYPFGCQ